MQRSEKCQFQISSSNSSQRSFNFFQLKPSENFCQRPLSAYWIWTQLPFPSYLINTFAQLEAYDFLQVVHLDFTHYWCICESLIFFTFKLCTDFGWGKINVGKTNYYILPFYFLMGTIRIIEIIHRYRNHRPCNILS